MNHRTNEIGWQAENLQVPQANHRYWVEGCNTLLSNLLIGNQTPCIPTNKVISQSILANSQVIDPGSIKRGSSKNQTHYRPP